MANPDLYPLIPLPRLHCSSLHNLCDCCLCRTTSGVICWRDASSLHGNRPSRASWTLCTSTRSSLSWQLDPLRIPPPSAPCRTSTRPSPGSATTITRRYTARPRRSPERGTTASTPNPSKTQRVMLPTRRDSSLHGCRMRMPFPR